MQVVIYIFFISIFNFTQYNIILSILSKLLIQKEAYAVDIIDIEPTKNHSFNLKDWEGWSNSYNLGGGPIGGGLWINC